MGERHTTWSGCAVLFGAAVRSPRTVLSGIRKPVLDDLSGRSAKEGTAFENFADALQQLYRVTQVVCVDLHDVPAVCLQASTARHVFATLDLVTVVLPLILDDHLARRNSKVSAVIKTTT